MPLLPISKNTKTSPSPLPLREQVKTKIYSVLPIMTESTLHIRSLLTTTNLQKTTTLTPQDKTSSKTINSRNTVPQLITFINHNSSNNTLRINSNNQLTTNKKIPTIFTIKPTTTPPSSSPIIIITRMSRTNRRSTP